MWAGHDSMIGGFVARGDGSAVLAAIELASAVVEVADEPMNNVVGNPKPSIHSHVHRLVIGSYTGVFSEIHTTPGQSFKQEQIPVMLLCTACDPVRHWMEHGGKFGVAARGLTTTGVGSRPGIQEQLHFSVEGS